MTRKVLFSLLLLLLTSCTNVDDIQKLRIAAKRGDAHSQYILGAMYQTGTWVKGDGVEALKWFHLAAEQGDLRSMYELGIMYEKGIGVKRDRLVAEEWYRKAGKGGYQPAEEALTRLHKNEL
jgi:hypothetical protein